MVALVHNTRGLKCNTSSERPRERERDATLVKGERGRERDIRESGREI